MCRLHLFQPSDWPTWPYASRLYRHLLVWCTPEAAWQPANAVGFGGGFFYVLKIPTYVCTSLPHVLYLYLLLLLGLHIQNCTLIRLVQRPAWTFSACNQVLPLSYKLRDLDTILFCLALPPTKVLFRVLRSEVLFWCWNKNSHLD